MENDTTSKRPAVSLTLADLEANEKMNRELDEKKKEQEQRDAEIAADEEKKKLLENALASLGNLQRHIPASKVILSYMGNSVWREGNLSLVIGGEGSRKTFLVTLLVSAFLHDYDWAGFSSDNDHASDCDCLWIDTEQDEGDVYENIRRVNRAVGAPEDMNLPGFRFACMRPYAQQQRLEMTATLIKHFKPKVTVIDGIADLVTDVNNGEETGIIRDWLLQVTAEQRCHIVSVLHTNPNSEKARGHLGSELPRKAETVMLTQAHGEITTIDFPKTRKKRPEPFSFRINVQGLPEICETPQAIKKGKEDNMNLVIAMFGSRTDGMDAETAITALHEQMKLAKPTVQRSSARKRLERLVTGGYIRHDANGTYFSCCSLDENGNPTLCLA